MPVVVGLSSITGITTAVNSTDAAYKEYTDNKFSSSLPSITGNENEFLFTNGSSVSWQPIQAVQEYTTAGSYSFSIPTQAKKFTIEATGAGGGGASGDAMASAYVPGSLWTLRTAGTTLQMNALAFRNSLYLLGGVASTPIFWTLRTSGTALQFNASTYISDYILAGASGVLVSSTNAIQWSLRTSGTLGSINALGTYSGNYIAGGSGGTIMWTQRTSGFGTSTIFTLMYDGSNYFAAGAGGTLRVSTDTINWVFRTSGTTSQLGSSNGGNGLLYVSGATEPYVYAGSSGALATSTDSIAWILRTSPNSTASIQGIIYGALPSATYVRATATAGEIATSTNGIQWTLRTTGNTTNVINGLLYSTATTEYYINCRNNAALQTSTDAIVWTSRTTGSPSALYQVIYGDVYVVVGSQSISTSTNAIAWTLRTSGTTLSIAGLAYTSGSYVASGASGASLYSTDAITWVLRTSGFGASTIQSVAFGNNIFVQGGVGATLTTSTPTLLTSNGFGAYFSVSTDEIVWTLRTTNTNIETINSFAVDTSNRIVAGFTDYNGFTRDLITSTDSVTWELRTSGFGNTTINALIYANSLYVAGGNISSNVQWVLRTSGFGANNINALAFGNNTYVAGGASGILRTSTDAITWELRTSGITVQIASIVFGNGTYVFGGAVSNTLASSTDAISWTLRTVPFSTSINEVNYLNSIYFAGGASGTLRTSTDAISWELRTSGQTNSIVSSTYGNNSYIVGFQGGQLIVSTDTIAWTLRTSGFGSNNINGLTFGNNTYVAGGGSAVLNTSTDTITWTLRTFSGGVGNITDIIFESNIYIAGQTFSLKYSTDAITWTLRTASSSISWNSLTFGNNIYAAAGDSGGFATATQTSLTTLGLGLSTSTDSITWDAKIPGFGTSAVRALTYGTLYVAAGDAGRLSTSADGSNWIIRTSAFGANAINTLYYNNGVYVAGGVSASNSANTATSTDGIVWILRTTSTTSAINTIGFGNNTYIFGGASGLNATSTQNILSVFGNGAYFSTSTDTLIWFLRTTNIAIQTINSIGTSNDYIVAGCTDAIGNSGFISASTDGINWLLRTSGFGNTTINAMVYGDVYVAGGNLGTIVTQWTLRTANAFSSIAYASDKTEKYVSVGGSIMASSTDAISWTLRTMGVSGTPSMRAITYGNGYYVAMDYFNSSGGSSAFIIASTNAIQWTLRTNGFSNSKGLFLVYGNSGWVAATDNGAQSFVASTDTINWSTRTAVVFGVPGSTAPNGLAHANGYYLTYGNGNPSISTDTIVWTIRTAFGGAGALSYDGSLYFSDSGGLSVSTDTIAWTLRTSAFGGLVAYDSANNFYVSSAGASTDGIVWFARTMDSASAITTLFVGDSNVYISASTSRFATATRTSLGDLVQNGVLQTSTDTIVWTFRTTTDTSNNINGLAYTSTPSSRYVAVRNSGFIQTSTDAIIWTGTAAIPTTQNLNAVVYGAVYVAAGASGVILSSTDSTTWVLRTSGFGTTIIRGLSYGGSTYVANGDSGKVATSTDAITWVLRTSNTAQNLLGDVGVGSTFITAGAAGAVSASPVLLGVGGAGGGGGATVTWELDKSQITGSVLSINVGSGGTSNTAGAGTTVSWSGPAGTYTITANGGSRGTAYVAGAGGTVPNTNFNYLRASAGVAGASPTLVANTTPTAATAATLAYQTTGGGAGAYTNDYNITAGILGSSAGTINYYNNTLAGTQGSSLIGTPATSISGLSYGNGAGGGGSVSRPYTFFTQRTSGFGTSNIHTLMYDGSNYFAAGAGGTLRVSTDTINWVFRTSGTTSAIGQSASLGYGVGSNGLLYVSGATEPYVYVGASGLLATSTNAIVWILRTSGTTGNIIAVNYNTSPSPFYSFAAGSTITTSTDGIRWSVLGGPGATINSFVYSTATSNYYVTAHGTSLSTSTNGIQWTVRTLPLGSSNFNPGISIMSAVAYYNNFYLATGYTTVSSGLDYSYIWASTDAISWVLRTSTTAYPAGGQYIIGFSYDFTNSSYYAYGGANNVAQLLGSTDTITWVLRTSGFGITGILSVGFGNNFIVNGGYSGTLTTSSNTNNPGPGGLGIKGGGGGGGGYAETTNSAGAGGTGGDGYVRISWV